MKINRPFNQLSKNEYLHFIEHHADYSDFNTLGLYRSISENESLDLAGRIEVRDFANRFFEKTFEFLQVKDPRTYFELTTLGEELTKADEVQVWRDISRNQQRILSDKKIKHRNFGEHSRHHCGHPDCPFEGMMIRQDSWLTEYHMTFATDRNRDGVKAKSQRLKKERKGKNWLKEEE